MKTELGLIIKGPLVDDLDVQRVTLYLSGREWVRAADLERELNLSDRELRAIAEMSNGDIISGQRGYRLFDRSTPIGEADHAASWLESQARKMILRASAIRRRIHKYGREQTQQAVIVA